MSRWRQVLLDLLFPPRCVFCGRLLEEGEGICPHCVRALPYTHGTGAEQRGEGITLAVSPLRYEGEVRQSIRRYKFEGRRWYARTYGGLMAACVREHLDGRFDALTWVPLSQRRRKERGYDQALLLARSVGEHLGMEPEEVLCKVRHTRAQSGLSDGEERRANVRDAYRCSRPERVAGRRFLLVDDVITTGSTLAACAAVLRQAGAADVVCVTAARAH